MSRPERASADYPEPTKNVAEHGEVTVLPATKARQGIIVRPMIYVLTIGMALAILLLALAYLRVFPQG